MSAINNELFKKKLRNVLVISISIVFNGVRTNFFIENSELTTIFLQPTQE